VDQLPNPYMTAHRRGGFVVGALQSLGIYLAMVVLFAAVERHVPGLRRLGAGVPMHAELSLVATATALVALGMRHARHDRTRTAAGVIIGAFLWPPTVVVLAMVLLVVTRPSLPFPP
jgi:uncharacterized membrane protein YedE/YeeE